jgi:hypothetical protein
MAQAAGALEPSIGGGSKPGAGADTEGYSETESGRATVEQRNKQGGRDAVGARAGEKKNAAWLLFFSKALARCVCTLPRSKRGASTKIVGCG